MLDGFFGSAVRLRNTLYDSGRFRAHRLLGPVVSVGNISVGGAGKTPFVIALGGLLRQRGVEFDVLSRGYRRATTGVLEVDPSGSAVDFGDEPLLISRRLNVPVIVGESRYKAGRWSEGKYGPRLHLLDDGFQHRRLARDFDIVLVTAADLDDRLLPSGHLREPLDSIRRADAIVVSDDLDRNRLPLHADQALWRIHRGIEIPPLRSFASFAVDSVPPRPPAVSGSQSTIDKRQSEIESRLLAFCAIARPSRFFDDLRNAGLSIAAEMPFHDHHRYTAADVDLLTASAAKANATGFVTTEKDLVNLGPLISRLEPLHVARVTLELHDSGRALDHLLSRIQKSKIENQK